MVNTKAINQNLLILIDGFFDVEKNKKSHVYVAKAVL